jgi:tRNA1Val (adenine37-N6)-methyltransferase
MANPYFQFKQFIIKQDRCAMKVGTDGVLLGAWIKTGKFEHILDIGTGTGLIALMLAQKTDAKITAVEIDTESFMQAAENIQASKWADRIGLLNISFQEYTEICDQKFDLIVTNPPYFEKSYKTGITSRVVARHSDFLPKSDIINGVYKLLSPSGSFYTILPADQELSFVKEAEACHLFCSEKCFVIPSPGKSYERILFEFRREQQTCRKDEIMIETEIRHKYTVKYKELTQAFYL